MNKRPWVWEEKSMRWVGGKREGEEIIYTVFVLYSCTKFSENKLDEDIGDIDI